MKTLIKANLLSIKKKLFLQVICLLVYDIKDNINVKEVLKSFHKVTPFKGTHLIGAEEIIENEENNSIEDNIAPSIFTQTPSDPSNLTNPAETQCDFLINEPILSKIPNYTKQIFELQKDAGDYQPTTFESIPTEQFLKEPDPPAVQFKTFKESALSQEINAQLEQIYKKVCISEVPLLIKNLIDKNNTDLHIETVEDPEPHILHNTQLEASKNIWEITKQSPNFFVNLKDHGFIPYNKRTKEIAAYLDIRNPILRKLLICICKDTSLKTAELLHAISVTGYLSTPHLEYGKKPYCIINTNDKSFPLNSILSMDILCSFSKTTISIITCGFEHCTVLTSAGTVASWGYNGSGCLGHGNYVTYTSPKLIKGLPGNIIYIESGAYHTGAINSDGDLYMWGRSDVGQLGLPLKLVQKDTMGYVALSPIEIELFKGETRRIALGEAHTLVLNNRGEVFSSGWNQNGQCGKDKFTEKTDPSGLFEKIRELQKYDIMSIGAGSLFSCAINSKGQVFYWGNNQCGQGGHMNAKIPENTKIPYQVDINNEFAVEIFCGEAHALAYCKNGKVYGWGQGYIDNNLGSDSARELVRIDPEQISKIDSIQYYGVESFPLAASLENPLTDSQNKSQNV